MNPTIKLAVGALAGIVAAPYLLQAMGIAPAAGFGMDDGVTAFCVVAGIMLVGKVL